MDYELTVSSLKDQGHRLTSTRREMVRIFAQNSTPLSAKRIEEMLLKQKHRVNKTTIYRELRFLLANGYICEVYLSPNEVSYESASLPHHHHLVCENCGNVDNITNCLVPGLAADILKKKSFKILHHTLEFYGLCRKCALQI